MIENLQITRVEVKAVPERQLKDEWTWRSGPTRVFYDLPGFFGYYPLPPWRHKPRTRREKRALRQFNQAASKRDWPLVMTCSTVLN